MRELVEPLRHVRSEPLSYEDARAPCSPASAPRRRPVCVVRAEAVPGKLAPRPPLFPRVPFLSTQRLLLVAHLRKRDRMASSSAGSTSYIVGWCVGRIVSYSSWLRMLRSNLHGTDIRFLHSCGCLLT